MTRIVVNKGIIKGVLNLAPREFVTEATAARKPMAAISRLRSTAMDVPSRPQWLVSGYIEIASIKKRMLCQNVSLLGLPVACKSGPAVAAMDLTKPAITRIWRGGTIGNHLGPKTILMKSGARINISPARGNDKKAVSCNIFKYDSLKYEGSS